MAKNRVKRRHSSLICLEIEAEKIVAARFEPATSTPSPLATAIVDRQGQTLAESLAKMREKLGCGGEAVCRVGLAADLFSFRSVLLPFADERKIAQVLPMELAERVPGEIDRLCLDGINVSVTPAGATVLAAMIERQELALVTKALAEVGWAAESLTIAGFDLAAALAAEACQDWLLVDDGASRATLFLARNRRIAAIRALPESVAAGGEEMAKVIRQTVLASGLSELLGAEIPFYYNGTAPPPAPLAPWTPRPCPQGVAAAGRDERLPAEQLRRLVAMAGRDRGEKDRFEFCKGPFRPRPTSWPTLPGRRRGLWALSLMLLAASLYLAFDFFGLMAERDQLRRQVAETFHQAAGAETRMVDPVAQLQVLIKDLQASGANGGGSGPAMVELLAEISLRIPAEVPVRLTRFSAEADMLLLKGVTGDFNSVETARAALEASPMFRGVTIAAANQEERSRQVAFELHLLLAR